jgi:predicted lipoprotein with Yx(FWY)xxD motif
MRLNSEVAIKPVRVATSQRCVKVFFGFAAIALVGASCGEHEGKLTPVGAAGMGSSGAPSDALPGGAAGRSPAASEAGAGGKAPTDGGAPSLDESGGAPAGPAECIYQSDAEIAAGGVPGAAGASGAGGAAAGPTLAKATNRALGDYLTDGAGRTLYVFGADLAGDCESPPVSTCEGDCLLSWPIFHAEPRELGPGLDAGAFGSFLRADGTPQTTYYGWPLYYYKNDLKPGDATGHGSGVWGLAELILPNIIVRRRDNDRFLADGAGRTLYAFADDTLGTPTGDAESACTGACLDEHPPFSPRYVGPISTLEARDFRVFLRADGEPQLSYKGAPLYYSALDDRPGAVNGADDQGFTIVLK